MPFRDIARLLRHPELVTTYHTGLIQAKAYRVLKKHTRQLLKPYDLSTLDWALLGLLKGSEGGVRSLAIARALGVEQPFVTVMLAKLKDKLIVDVRRDPKDGRARLVSLTAEGEAKVDEVEKVLRKQMRPLLKGNSISDLVTYVKVLEKIVKNAEEVEQE